MKFIDKVRGKITSARTKAENLWPSVSTHSREYMNRLGLSYDELEKLEETQKITGEMYPTIEDKGRNGFLTITIEGKTFALIVKNVCAHSYGANGWVYCIFAICVNDPSLNTSTGNGTALITAISEEWHRKLVAQLDEEEIQENDSSLAS